MDEKYSALFTPFKIGNVEIKNRIVQCSMGGTSLFGWLEPCHFDKEAANFLLQRAKDGVGLILPGMQCVRDTMGCRWLWQNDRMFKELAAWMPEFHKTGAKLFIQLAAGFGRSMAVTSWMVMLNKKPLLGKLASPFVDVSFSCASASATPNRWQEDMLSRPMTVEEIHTMVDAFGKTAKKLRDAGVDGVEIHAVHEGYLLDQFTIANWNSRTDQYGGSFENRFRFPVEIVQSIKRQAGADFPVSLRYSVVSKTKSWFHGAMPGEEFEEFGRDMPESEKAVKYLEEAGYDFFNCDNGTYDAWYWAHPPQYMPDNCNLADVEHIRQFTNVPVACAGRMDPVKAAEEIAAGRLDAVDAGLAQLLGGGAEVPDHLLDLLDREGTGGQAVGPAVGRGGSGSAGVLHVDDRAGQLVQEVVLAESGHPGRNGHRTAEAAGQLDEQLSAGLVVLIHVGLENAVHLAVGVEPLSAHRVADDLHAGQDQADAVLGALEQEICAFNVEVRRLEPAENGGAAHGALHDTVGNLYFSDLERSKQSFILLIHTVSPFQILVFRRWLHSRKQRSDEVDRPHEQIADQIELVLDGKVQILVHNFEELFSDGVDLESLDQKIAHTAEAGDDKQLLCFLHGCFSLLL